MHWSVSFTVPSTTATASTLSGPYDHFICLTTPSTLRTKPTKFISRAPTFNLNIPNRLGNNCPNLFSLPRTSLVRIPHRKTYSFPHRKLHHKPYRAPHRLLRCPETPCAHTLTSIHTTVSTAVRISRSPRHYLPPGWEASLNRSMRHVAI